MPIYEYKCLDCERQFEIMLKVTDEGPKNCLDCGGQIRKLISNTSFILKGTGWYVTDYASSDRKKAVEADKDSNGQKPVAAASADKSETKAEAPLKTEPKVT